MNDTTTMTPDEANAAAGIHKLAAFWRKRKVPVEVGIATLMTFLEKTVAIDLGTDDHEAASQLARMFGEMASELDGKGEVQFVTRLGRATLQ